MIILVRGVPKDMLFQQHRCASVFCNFIDLIHYIDVNVPQFHITFPELAGKIQDAAAQLRQLLLLMWYLNWNIDIICVWFLAMCV
jgi:hypothetical protein